MMLYPSKTLAKEGHPDPEFSGEGSCTIIIMTILALGLVIIPLILWIIGFIYANDFSVSLQNLQKISSQFINILIVFPHADDEALSTGGLIYQISRKNVTTTWLILTKGEKGNENATFDEQLKHVRVAESKKVASIYGIKNIIQKDYPDNGITEYKKKLKEDLKQTIGDLQPDLIITYDLAGLYGHPDHITTSELVTYLVRNEFKNTQLWYVSSPKKIIDATSLPEHMAKDSEYRNKRAYPNGKVWIGFQGIINKIRAVYAYKSQQESYTSALPIKAIPLWFYISLQPYEYFHIVT